MPPGGARTGTPGKSYGSRSDLNENYGDKVALERQTAAVPIPPAGAAPAATPVARARPVPPGAFNRATERPDEPVTAGLDTGPGPDGSVLGLGGDLVAELKALYAARPSRQLLALIYEAMDEQGPGV